MSSGQDEQNVTKVQPYPFNVSIDKEGQKTVVEALNLVSHGLLIDMKSLIFKVGDRISMQLVLPAGYGTINADGKVIKTYDQASMQPGAGHRHIAEIHFLRNPLPEQDNQVVKRFLKAISKGGTAKK